MGSLRVEEFNVFSRNDFFVSLLELKSKKNEKNDKKEPLLILSTDYWTVC